MNAAFRLSLTARGCRYLLALGLLAGADSCRADGDLSGIAIFMFWAVCFFAVLWLAFSGFVCYLLRRQRARVRFGVTGLVLLLPLLSLLLDFGSEWLHEKLRAPLHETSLRESSLLGVPLPAGSVLEYQEDGPWGRTLVKATPPEPVMVGDLRVRSLRRSADDTLDVALVADQPIDGWHCLASQPVTLHRANGIWHLSACSIAATRIGDIAWQSATQMERSDDHVDLTWFDEPYLCGGTCSPMFWNGLQLSLAQGKYDVQMHLLDWGGTTAKGESRIAPYRFGAWADLQRLASGEVEIRGNGHDSRDDSTIACVVVGADGSKPRRCASPQ
jgi:hypothetical protein